MTNYEHLQKLNLHQLALWLDKYLTFDNAPHTKWFDESFCSKCESIQCEYRDYPGRNFEASFCEVNGHCRFFPEFDSTPDSLFILKMWLEQEAEDIENKEVINND